MYSALSTILGISYPHLLVREPPNFDMCFHGGSKGSLRSIEWPTGAKAVLLDFHQVAEKVNYTKVLKKEFLQLMRSGSGALAIPTRHFQAGVNVALHVRRGDVGESATDGQQEEVIERHFAEDQIYLKVAKQVLSFHPAAAVHVFSTTGKQWNSSDFDIFRKEGFTVHLDGDEINDWAHMAQANVLIAAPSAFSATAGIFNSNCVLAFEGFVHPLRPWLLGRDDSRYFLLIDAFFCVLSKGVEKGHRRTKR